MESHPTQVAGARHPLVRLLLIAMAIAFLLLVLLAGVVAMQSGEFRIERSMAMSAPPEAVFAQVNDFHNWNDWSPWAKLDPNARNTFEGPSSGEGAKFSWAGNSDIGEGGMTITESQPNERVRIRLEFIKPFEDTADTLFTFEPNGEQTNVHWSMAGQNNFIGKAMCLVMDMDQMVGGQFEEGLANMKAIVEKNPRP